MLLASSGCGDITVYSTVDRTATALPCNRDPAPHVKSAEVDKLSSRVSLRLKLNSSQERGLASRVLLSFLLPM